MVRKSLITLFLCLSLSLILFGCSSSASDEGEAADDAGANSTLLRQKIALTGIEGLDFNIQEAERLIGTLTETATIDGLTISIDPAWSVQAFDFGTNVFLGDSQGVIQLFVYDNPGINSFESYVNNDGTLGATGSLEKLTMVGEWQHEGITYYAGKGHDKTISGSELSYFDILGVTNSSRGFFIGFDTKAIDKTLLTNDLIAAVISTIQFDPNVASAHSVDKSSLLEKNKTESNSTENNSSQKNNSSTIKSFYDILSRMGNFEPVTISGSGDDVIDIPCQGSPCIMTIDYTGSSNFIVKLLDDSGKDLDLLVNEIGAFHGVETTYGNYEFTTMVEVGASGPWTITISPMNTMTEAQNGSTFHGDDVVYIDVPSLTKISFTHTGDSNFVVHGVGVDKTDLLVNEIGAYKGTVAWNQPESFFIVTADGDWTISW